ncbi:DUF7543 family protein [Halobellus rufus]|uniref:DUF7543 family protein n=1 Tax=Halobellus rufus TaxID=1448860 RepID=UPI000679E0F2|nr:hypothetical protein [Halobellus rufus]
MEWSRSEDGEAFVEWTREDGYATIRRRQRADGGWVVHYDRLYQAPEGSGYRRERVADLEAADELVEAWQTSDPIE